MAKVAHEQQTVGSDRRFLRLGFSGLSLVVLFLLAMFHYEARQVQHTRNLVANTREEIGHIEAFFAKIKDAEAHMRDYLITGDVSYLADYNAIRNARSAQTEVGGRGDESPQTHIIFIEDRIQALRAANAATNEPEQMERLTQLEALLREEIRFMDKAMELRTTQGFEAAAAHIKEGQKSALLDRIRQLTSDFTREENEELTESMEIDTEISARNYWLAMSILALSLLLIAGTYILLARNLARRLRVEEELRETSEWQRAILTHSPYGIIATNEKGAIHIYNPAAERMFGYAAAEMIGKETPVLLHDQEELSKRTLELSDKMSRSVDTGFETLIAKASLEGMEECECTFLRKDGQPVPVLSSVTALKDAQREIIGYLFIAKDIAEQKRMEKMKSEFVSTVSHELRTPLTSIRGALGLITGGAVGEVPAKIMKLVDIAHKNSNRLVRIVNDILDAEKIDSGGMKLLMQQVDLTALVRQAIEANQAYAEKHGVRLVLRHTPDFALLMADPDRLMQMMANLISNAAKFSPEGSEVVIRVDAQAGSLLRISVQDYGPGIPEAFRGRIFEKFAQADGSAARGHEGTGLGLSITRRLAKAMGGTVGFTTETGKGSVFYVDLPALQEEAETVEPAATGQAGNRVLIVEDNRDNATLIKILLEQAGFGVDIAYTLAEARHKLAAESYAAMTLDLTLPDGEGITLIREVRLDPATHHLPIIVVSGKAEESKNALGGEAVSLIDWLVKPIDELQLVRALRHAVSHDDEGLPRILHVEDDPDISLILREMLKDQAEIVTATTLKKAGALLDRQNFALIVLDLSLPDGSGMELLKTMNTLAVKSTPVLILSASEASPDVRAQVAGALVKSRTSENKIVDTILALIHKSSSAKQAA